MIPSCDELKKNLTMSFEDATANRNLSLIGNTNIKTIQNGLHFRFCNEFQ